MDIWRTTPAGAIRMGDWKLVAARDSGGQKLFNLKDDVSEAKDLSATHPDKVKELQAASLQLISMSCDTGLEGRKIAFLHPKSTHGVLIELVECEAEA